MKAIFINADKASLHVSKVTYLEGEWWLLEHLSVGCKPLLWGKKLLSTSARSLLAMSCIRNRFEKHMLSVLLKCIRISSYGHEKCTYRAMYVMRKPFSLCFTIKEMPRKL